MLLLQPSVIYCFASSKLYNIPYHQSMFDRLKDFTEIESIKKYVTFKQLVPYFHTKIPSFYLFI